LRDTTDIPKPRAQDLLTWYDHHARVLPWRVGPAERATGVMPDPYRVWLSEIMLQQTTVATVRGRFPRFMTRWPSVRDLAATDEADVMAEWAGLGYYARARNLLKCARQVSDHMDGAFPGTYEGLLALPGIGPYTAAAISAIAYDLPSPVMDGNIERVMARLFAISTPLPAAKPVLRARVTDLTPQARPGDYAQAVMDLGATICTARRPTCSLCPWSGACLGHLTGRATDLPRKTAQKPKPTRHGIVYIGARADGALLLETRPDKGLLGGMLGWPGSDWEGADAPAPTPPADAAWQSLTGEIRHTFTHFHLILKVEFATLPQTAEPSVGQFMTPDRFRPGDLPTVMRKAYDLWRKHINRP